VRRLLLLLLVLLVLGGCRPTQSPTPTPSPQSNDPPGLILYLQDQRLHLRSGGEDRLLAELGTVVEPYEALLTKDGRQVLALAREATGAYVRSYTLADGQVATIKLQESPNSIVAWAPDASYLAFVTEGTAVVVLDRQGHLERLSFAGDQVLALTWGPDSRLLVTSRQGSDQNLRLWRWGRERTG
jgi:WD40 repeat protein